MSERPSQWEDVGRLLADMLNRRSQGRGPSLTGGTGDPAIDDPGFDSPMTDQGDLIYGGESGAPLRLAIGTEDYVLTVVDVGGILLPVWTALPTVHDPVTVNDTTSIDITLTGQLISAIVKEPWARTLILASVLAGDGVNPDFDFVAGTVTFNLDESWIEALVADMFAAGTQTGITVSYNSLLGALSLTVTGIPTTLDDLTDVDTASTPPSDGDALVFDSGSGLWLPGAVAAALAVDDLTDVVVTSVANRHVLVWDTSTGKWINIPLPRDLDGLNDVTLTGLADKDVLSYNASLGVFRNEPRWNLVTIPDVLITSLTNGDTLIWNTGSGKWVNQQPDTSSGDFSTLNFVIDGGGSAITTGIKGDLQVDFDGTISANTALADQAGSIVVDIWKDTYANYPPVDADSITASAPVTISSAIKSHDATLTGWTTTVTAGDILRFNVDSNTTIQRATIALKVARS